MDVHYYLMDDFVSLYFHGIWNGYFAYILLATFFAGYVRVACDHALLWISLASPFLRMTAARCANAAAGISDGCVVVQGIMPLPPCIEMCHDLRMHVSTKSNPARFHNE